MMTRLNNARDVLLQREMLDIVAPWHRGWLRYGLWTLSE